MTFNFIIIYFITDLINIINNLLPFQGAFIIKSYKLPLTGLLAVCFGLHAMENVLPYIAQQTGDSYLVEIIGNNHFTTESGPSYITRKINQPQQHNNKNSDKSDLTFNNGSDTFFEIRVAKK